MTADDQFTLRARPPAYVTEVDRILAILDGTGQSSTEHGYEALPASIGRCFRCAASVNAGDLCDGCRSWMSCETDVDPRSFNAADISDLIEVLNHHVGQTLAQIATQLAACMAPLTASIAAAIDACRALGIVPPEPGAVREIRGRPAGRARTCRHGNGIEACRHCSTGGFKARS